MSGEANFWQEADERHREIAETFYRNIEYEHPGSVTSNRMCPCLEYCNWCGWATTTVKYYRYNGPRVVNI